MGRRRMRSVSVLDIDKTPSEPPVGAQVPVGVARRVGAFLLRELREMLPPTIFFFVGFNLILLTTNLLIANYGAAVGSFMLVTGGALVVGKAVLVANATRSIRRYDRASARTLDPLLARRTPSARDLPAAHGCDVRLASLYRDPALDIGYILYL